MSPRVHFWLRGAILAVLAAGLCALVWPRPLGGQVSYVMVSGTSMQPKLHTDDLVVVRSQPHGYAKGDVIAYRIPDGEPGAGAQVIHRVIGGDGAHGYVTQGDNRTQADEWRPTDGDVLGKWWVLVPQGGHVMLELRQPATFAGLASALTVFSVVTWKPRRVERHAPTAYRS